MRPHLSLCLAVLATALAAPVSAQLDYPDPPREEGQKAPRRGRSVNGLDLPASLGRSRAEALGLVEEEAEPAPAVEAEPELDSLAPETILAELRKLGHAERAREAEFASRLLALGEPGLVAARKSMDSKIALVRSTAQRVLLTNGLEADRALVVAALHGRVPGRSASQLLQSLAEVDPVAASPALYLELLEHPQASMRTAAANLLAVDLDESRIGDLAKLMDSRHADTRLHAIQLASGLEAAPATELLFSGLRDEDARVAAQSARSLGRSRDESIDERLLAIVGESASFSRHQSYALLSIVEREDQRGVAILTSASTDVLLRNLAEGIDMAVGASACALAGIGFRSDRSTKSQWLELLVPHHLVRIVSGTEFHPDLASLEEPAQRRLALITGREFGGDGRAWLAWWTDSAMEFRAHRAFMPVTSAEAESLHLSYRSRSDGVSLQFHGGDVAVGGVVGAETYWLAKNQCIDLYRVLEKEGLFTAARLPSVRATGMTPERELSLSAGPYEKVFFVDQLAAEPWFERVVEVLYSLAEQNRWQRFFSESRRIEEPGAWAEEQEFWSRGRTELERGRRYKRLVLRSLSSLDEVGLAEGVQELERLFAQPGVADASDFVPLRARLESEPFYSPQVSRLVDLALSAARAERTSSAEQAPAELERALDGARAVDSLLARGLSSLVAERFGTAAIEELTRVFLASSVDFGRSNATSPRPVLRAAALRALALQPGAVFDELLARALADPESEVEAAAVQALGARSAALLDRPETRQLRLEWANEFAARLDSDVGTIQIAALRAMARSGDDRAIGAMLPALSSSKSAVRLAAAEGLANIEDPTVAPVLVSLLARGPRSIVFETARRGLAQLGQGAHEELLRIVNRREPGLSREAALILAEDGVPEVAASLLTILTEQPQDERVALELAVLTCVDYRGEPDPARAWWGWWDTVRQDSSEAWLFAAAERIGLRSPAEGALIGAGTREGAEFLLSLLQAKEEFLVARAERELVRLVGAEARLPTSQAERETFLARYWPR